MNYLELSAPPKLCELRKAQEMIDIKVNNMSLIELMCKYQSIYNYYELKINEAMAICKNDLILKGKSIVHVSESGEIRAVNPMSEEGMNVFAQAEKNPRKFLR